MSALRAAALFALLAAGPALAQGLSDPMRPANAAPTGAAPEAVAAPSGLQSILIAGARRVAVINGQTVAVGQRIGDATLVRVAETEVTLKRGDQFETLKLHPGVDKKLSAPRAPKGSGR